MHYRTGTEILLLWEERYQDIFFQKVKLDNLRLIRPILFIKYTIVYREILPKKGANTAILYAYCRYWIEKLIYVESIRDST